MKVIDMLKNRWYNARMKTIRTCEIMQYMEYMDCTYDEVVNRVKALPYLKTYAIILHDKDKLEDGSLKPPHFHCVLTFVQPVTITFISANLGLEPQYIEKIHSTTAKAQLYLIHRNAPGKFQYPIDEVTCNIDYQRLISDDIEKPMEKVDRLCQDIISGKIRKWNYALQIDSNLYIKYKRYFDNAFKFRNDLIQQKERNMEVYYISGASGIGKSRLASYLAKTSFNCDGVYRSSMGKNALDDYGNEECIILDDFRIDDYEYQDLLKMLDNWHSSNVSCRFYNKSINECRVMFLTYTKPLSALFQCDKQFFRRISGSFHFIDANSIRMTAYEDGVSVKSVVIPNPLPVIDGVSRGVCLMNKLISQYGIFEDKDK